jgi:hypothetical protein
VPFDRSGADPELPPSAATGWRTGNAVKAVTSSRGRIISRGFLSGETFAVGAGHSQLEHLAVLQVSETQATCPGDEDVEYCPAQAEATGLAGKATNHLGTPRDFFE